MENSKRHSYTHLNAEFQRIARRDKKAFLSGQCKEIEENIRMGKTRALFKKIRGTKGTFHAKIDTIKDRNGMDLTDAEDIKKRWQVSQKDKDQYSIQTHIYGILKDGNDNPICKTEKETQMYRVDF